MGDSLRDEVTKFALELGETVRTVSPNVEPFKITVVQDRTGSSARIRVHQADPLGVDLTVETKPVMAVTVEMLLTWDSVGRYLAVDNSKIAVFARTARKVVREPLFRYEYVHDQRVGLPGAHIQVHAHRDTATYLMARCGVETRTGRSRSRDVVDGEDVPSLQDLHFPVGGTRFRPCLEDVLEMVIEEFGIDCSPEGRQALSAGRLAWRRKQLGAAVRDDPATAARVLGELGFSVTDPPGGPPAARTERLAAP